MSMAGTAGAAGAFFGTPADVALVRMTIDGRLPVGNDKFLLMLEKIFLSQENYLIF